MTAVLAIDTAGPRLQLALAHGAAMAVLVEHMTQGQAERLFPAIEGLLGREDQAYGGLDRVAVVTGPGSFTGVRVALSAARGLGLVLGIPVIGLPTLAAVSLSAKGGGPIAVLLDARRGEAYVQLFSAPGVAEGAPTLMPMDAAHDLLPVGAELIADAAPDIARVAAFAASADPEAFPPIAAYVRDADAKPQDRFRVPRVTPA